MTKSWIFGQIFDEICIYDERKNDIFGGKVLWSLTITWHSGSVHGQDTEWRISWFKVAVVRQPGKIV